MELNVESMEMVIKEVNDVFKRYEVENYRKMLWKMILWDMEEETCESVTNYGQYRRLVDRKMELELDRLLCGE